MGRHPEGYSDPARRPPNDLSLGILWAAIIGCYAPASQSEVDQPQSIKARINTS